MDPVIIWRKKFTIILSAKKLRARGKPLKKCFHCFDDDNALRDAATEWLNCQVSDFLEVGISKLVKRYDVSMCMAIMSNFKVQLQFSKVYNKCSVITSVPLFSNGGFFPNDHPYIS